MRRAATQLALLELSQGEKTAELGTAVLRSSEDIALEGRDRGEAYGDGPLSSTPFRARASLLQLAEAER